MPLATTSTSPGNGLVRRDLIKLALPFITAMRAFGGGLSVSQRSAIAMVGVTSPDNSLQLGLAAFAVPRLGGEGLLIGKSEALSFAKAMHSVRTGAVLASIPVSLKFVLAVPSAECDVPLAEKIAMAVERDALGQPVSQIMSVLRSTVAVTAGVAAVDVTLVSLGQRLVGLSSQAYQSLQAGVLMRFAVPNVPVDVPSIAQSSYDEYTQDPASTYSEAVQRIALEDVSQKLSQNRRAK